jgi:hypothetical protein
VGIVVAAYERLGVALPDFRLYGREPYNDGLLRHTEAALGPSIIGTPQDGDVVVIRFHVNPHHVAIVGTKAYGQTEALTLIHSEGSIGRVLEQRLTPDVKITHVFRRPV